MDLLSLPLPPRSRRSKALDTAKRKRSNSRPSSPYSVPPNSKRVVSTSTRSVATMRVNAVDVAAVVAVVATAHALLAGAVVPVKVVRVVTAPRPRVVVAVPTAEVATVREAVAVPNVASVAVSVVAVAAPKTEDPDTTALPRLLRVERASVPITIDVAKARSKDSRESLVRSGTPWTNTLELSERRFRERAVTEPVALATRTLKPKTPPSRKRAPKVRSSRRRKEMRRPRLRTEKRLSPKDAVAKKRRKLPRKTRRPSPESTLLITRQRRLRTSS